MVVAKTDSIFCFGAAQYATLCFNVGPFQPDSSVITPFIVCPRGSSVSNNPIRTFDHELCFIAFCVPEVEVLEGTLHNARRYRFLGIKTDSNHFRTVNVDCVTLGTAVECHLRHCRERFCNGCSQS